MEHGPGTFCWAELVTTDPAAAKKFYTELFAWDTHDDPVPGGGLYTMLRLDGKNVGALYEMRKEQQEAHTPPHWGSYISVTHVDDTISKAKQLDGQVIVEPFDVMQVGRMAVIKDVAGAFVSLWQPKIHQGYDFDDGRPGTVCWNELFTNDPEATATFYGNLFGWTVEKFPEMDYHMFNHGGKQIAGMIKIRPEMGPVPPHWMIYVAVQNCEQSTARAKELGAQTHVEPRDIPGIGRFSVLGDPQGAGFALWQQAT